MRTTAQLLAIAVAMLATSLHAREAAVLRNGFAISHDHHKQMGSTTRLFLSSSEEQFVDTLTENIVSFEKEDDPLPIAVPVQNPAISPKPDLKQIVSAAARDNQLDSDFVDAVIRAESNGNTKAVSRKGAQGLMQLMPGTASQLGVKNSFDPNENVNAGSKYLRELLARYNNDPVRALAAYNAGVGRVQQYHGVPPYHETRAYVSKVVRDFNQRKIEQQRAAKKQTKPAKTAAVNQHPDGN
jgi:soluble lytic murein transglycosylase-like protein